MENKKNKKEETMFDPTELPELPDELENIEDIEDIEEEEPPFMEETERNVEYDISPKQLDELGDELSDKGLSQKTIVLENNHWYEGYALEAEPPMRLGPKSPSFIVAIQVGGHLLEHAVYFNIRKNVGIIVRSRMRNEARCAKSFYEVRAKEGAKEGEGEGKGIQPCFKVGKRGLFRVIKCENDKYRDWKIVSVKPFEELLTSPQPEMGTPKQPKKPKKPKPTLQVQQPKTKAAPETALERAKRKLREEKLHSG